MVNLNKFCRTCLSREVLFAPSSKCQINGEFISVKEMLKECTGINISNADFLPKKLCASCIVGVRTSYTFCLQSLLTQKYIVELLNDLKSDTSGTALENVISLREKVINKYKNESSNDAALNLYEVSDDSDVNTCIKEENITDKLKYDYIETESDPHYYISTTDPLDTIINEYEDEEEEDADSKLFAPGELSLLDNDNGPSAKGEAHFKAEPKSPTSNRLIEKCKINRSSVVLDRVGLITNPKRGHRPFVCSCGADYVRESDLLTHSNLQGHFSPGLLKIDIKTDPVDAEPLISQCDYSEDLKTPEPLPVINKVSGEVSDTSTTNPDPTRAGSNESVPLSGGLRAPFKRSMRRGLLDAPRSYSCECGRTYIRKSDLDRHRKNKNHSVVKVGGKNRGPNQGNGSLYNNNMSDSDIFALAINIENTEEYELEKGRTGKPYKYMCVCGNKYCGKYDFIRHVKWKHLNSKKYQKREPQPADNQVICSKCSKIIDVENYEDHVKKRHMNIRCETCGIILHGTIRAEAHQTGQHNLPHTCNMCHKTFSNRNNLKTHEKIHFEVGQHLCSFCGRSFRAASTLKIHIRRHTNDRPYNCLFDGCGKAFYTQSLLRSHRRTHSHDKPFMCEDCPKRFASSILLSSHRRYHKKERPFKCQICPAAFKSGGTLITHNRTHTGEKPFGCEFCKSSFTTKSSLLIHTRRHTKERPFKCKLCSFATVTGFVLTRHMNRRHTGKRKYPCKYAECDKIFFTPSERSKHQTIHLKLQDKLKANPIKSLTEDVDACEEATEEQIIETVEESMETEYLLEEYENAFDDVYEDFITDEEIVYFDEEVSIDS